MSAPAFQSLAECTPQHSSRDIRYIFLESCRNIPASQHGLDGAGGSSVPPGPAPCHPSAQRQLDTDNDCGSSLPQRLLALSMRVGVEAMEGRGSPGAKKRLPVFRRLCGEAVEELKKFPEAQAALGSTKGWRIPLAGGRVPALQHGMN